jgi:hypothetical protein
MSGFYPQKHFETAPQTDFHMVGRGSHNMTDAVQVPPTPPRMRIPAVARLMLIALARSNRALTIKELTTQVPCCHGSASQLTRRLTAAGLLISLDPELGLPRSFKINPEALGSPTSPFRDAALEELLKDFPKVATR